MKKSKAETPADPAAEMAKTLKAAAYNITTLNHPLRLQILAFVSGQAQIVTDIYGHLGREQSETSQHLKRLRKSGLVFADRKGKNVFYLANLERIEQIEEYAKKIAG